jgi:flagellin-like hook-associated protein FlgL
MLSVISSGQVAKHNLSTRNLIKRTHGANSNGSGSMIGGVIAGSNATETSSFLKNSTIQSSLRTKGNLSKSIQNAVSFVQTQQSKMEMLEDIYKRMTELAGYATDPFLDEQVRTQYASEFQALKKVSIDVGKETFQGKALFDEMAAKYFPPIDYGKGFRSDDNGSLVVHDGTVPSSERLDGLSKYYEVEKEVYFDKGKFSLEINGGNTGERYMLKQGDHIIFDTAGGSSGDNKWATVGNAWQYDFDKFEIEYSPGKPTTFKFVPQSAGNGTSVKVPEEQPDDGTFDNKSKYISQLGLGSYDNKGKTTPWNEGDDNTGTVFSGEVGEVKTYPAIAGETKLTLRVEASSIFQVKAEYTNLNNPESSFQVQVGEGSSLDLAPVGVGLSLVNSNLDSPEDAGEALELLENEMESVSVQMGTIGANLSKLEVASEHIENQVIAGDSFENTMMDEASIDRQIESAKSGIILEGSRTLLAKAINTTRNIVSLLF